MAPIVAPDICRYTINQTLGGQPVVNIVDMWVISTNPLEDRATHLYEVAGDILNNWSDHVLAGQVDNLVAESISWIDLDSLDGVRGERSSTDDNDWPQSGGLTAQATMPAVVAFRIDKNTSGGRGTKSGRMYLSGIPEDFTDPNSAQSWGPTVVDGLNAQMASFLSGINNEEGPDGKEQDMVVIHTRDGVYRDYSIVTSLTANSAVSTQVRRGVLR